MGRRFLVKVVQHDRRSLDDVLHFDVLAVENAQRVLLEPANTILIEPRFHARKVLNEGALP